MPADQELVLIFGALHLMALVFGGLLLTMFFRSEALPGYRPPEDEDDGGGGDDGPPPEQPTTPRPDGIVVDEGEPARVRLREPGRIAERDRWPVRRPEHAPQRKVPAR